MPRRRHSSPRMTLLSLSWKLCWITVEGTRLDHVLFEPVRMLEQYCIMYNKLVRSY
jgi:hypothetical protein